MLGTSAAGFFILEQVMTWESSCLLHHDVRGDAPGSSLHQYSKRRQPVSASRSRPISTSGDDLDHQIGVELAQAPLLADARKFSRRKASFARSHVQACHHERILKSGATLCRSSRTGSCARPVSSKACSPRRGADILGHNEMQRGRLASMRGVGAIKRRTHSGSSTRRRRARGLPARLDGHRRTSRRRSIPQGRRAASATAERLVVGPVQVGLLLPPPSKLQYAAAALVGALLSCRSAYSSNLTSLAGM